MDFMEPEYHKNWPGAALEYYVTVTHKCLLAVCFDLGQLHVPRLDTL